MQQMPLPGTQPPADMGSERRMPIIANTEDRPTFNQFYVVGLCCVAALIVGGLAIGAGAPNATEFSDVFIGM
jgi:hypothetical protein